MDIELATTAFFVTLVYVFLRAFQQLNVVNRNYWMVMPTSVLMSVGDVAIVLIIVRADTLWMGVTNGIGGGLGCMLAMFISHKVWGKK